MEARPCARAHYAPARPEFPGPAVVGPGSRFSVLPPAGPGLARRRGFRAGRPSPQVGRAARSPGLRGLGRRLPSALDPGAGTHWTQPRRRTPACSSRIPETGVSETIGALVR
jgi:hypothetical protein